MRVAVFSDSHGRIDKMIHALQSWRPDLIVHLGDYARDAEHLKKEFPQTPVRAVRGNCDIRSYALEKDFFDIGQVKVFITHGHIYGVKRSLDALLNAAYFSGARVALYGHTHIAHCRQIGGLWVINPGSAGQGMKPSYARLEIGEDGSVNCQIVPINI
ncbi:MAG: metallophosphoesterase family protein [Oscillospiraceae bacterium]|jgi:putative phosphoesterase